MADSLPYVSSSLLGNETIARRFVCLKLQLRQVIFPQPSSVMKAHLYLDLQKHYCFFNGSRTAPQNIGLSRQEWQQCAYGGGCANPASVGFVWAVQANVRMFSDMAYVEKSSTSQALKQQEMKYVLKMIKTLLTKTQHNKQIWLLLSSRIC